MFLNEPFSDFGISANSDAMSAALKRLDAKIAQGELRAVPIVAGTPCAGEEDYSSTDPASPEVTLGRVRFASIDEAESALENLQQGFPAWRDTAFEKRAEIIRAAGVRMRENKFDLAALIVREAGKNWREADADVAEAIDFCEYYAEEMLRLGPPQKMGSVMGEENQYFYQPRGIGVVISPWNFPLAIACGMTVAGLVTGNCVVLKPSEQTSLIASELARILYECGVPKNVFAFLPGRGEKIGAHMVDSAKVDYICFTGSKAVGLHIIEAASEVKEGQRNVKRVVAEMGGKNAIVVDEDADLDEAIKGVLQSAFGFAGQKCSACSRAIIVGTAYDTFIERLKNAAGDLIVGLPKERSTFLSPVIDEEAKSRILKMIDQGKSQDELLFQGKVPENGNFIPITIFKDVKPSSKLWSDEIFGPVLGCTKAKDFDQAIKLANDSAYALTGAVYSRSPKNIEKARKDFRVGNLYINRGSTGALVYRQPFGGFKMSGVGSKAGGPDYLIQFMEPRVVTENTMRRGFAPEMKAK